MDQIPMPLGGNRTNYTNNLGLAPQTKKSKPNKRSSGQTALPKIRIAWRNQLIKATDFVLKLAANPAHEQIAKARHHSQHYTWTIFDLSIRLPKRGENYIPFFHREWGVG
jgi:hypothetical protein